jgi:hypothetical protein
VSGRTEEILETLEKVQPLLDAVTMEAPQGALSHDEAAALGVVRTVVGAAKVGADLAGAKDASAWIGVVAAFLDALPWEGVKRWLQGLQEVHNRMKAGTFTIGAGVPIEPSRSTSPRRGAPRASGESVTGDPKAEKPPEVRPVQGSGLRGLRSLGASPFPIPRQIPGV